MNFGQKIALYLWLYLVLGSVAFAQVVDIPDPNLRAAIHESLQRPEHLPINRAAMLYVVRIDARNRGITDLTGLEFATNLEYLELARNPISDLTPAANLTKLRWLFAWHCEITDISPLTNLTELRYLDLSYNRIDDISALAGLTNLIELLLRFNDIGDVRPLANLTRLEVLNLMDNKIGDHSPLDELSLRDYKYDETCVLPSLPLEPRVNNRTYPSLIAAWGGPGWIRTLNRPDSSDIANLASHDLWFSVPQFGLDLDGTSHGFKIRGSLDEAILRRDEFHAINPNMIFLVDIRMREYWDHEAPEDWPYWIRDANGERVSKWPGAYLVDFTQPEVQDRIVQQAVAVSKCGLYDGIFFDYWRDGRDVLENYVSIEAQTHARQNILRRIRQAVRPNFIIMGNTNVHSLPSSHMHMNGSWMETPVPGDLTEDEAVYWLGRAEESLRWLESNTREPRTNALKGHAIPTEPLDSPANLRWMRAITTMSLTYSDGYFLFSKFISNHHNWYDFWDADLGKPVGPKSQLYDENILGLYIREYTNGWAVHNHSGEPKVITLPEEVQGVASSHVGTEHTLPNLDGEIYLRVTPVNPADVNGDGIVNILDLTLVARGFGTDNLEGDVNGDGVVNVIDLVFVANQF